MFSALLILAMPQILRPPQPLPKIPEVLTPEEWRAEVSEKEARVRDFLRRRGLDALLIQSYRNFAWITGGMCNRVVYSAEAGVASLLLRSDGKKFVITANDEIERFMVEELAGLGYEPVVYDWHKALSEDARTKAITSLVPGGRIGSDLPFPGAEDVSLEIIRLRLKLTSPEIKKYRWLGRRCGEAVAWVARSLQPGDTEEQIASAISAILLRQGITPTVLLMGADERIFRYRHTIVRGGVVHRYAQVNLCAEKWGLVVALTRLVHFGPLPPELRRNQDAVMRVYARFVAATKPGRTLGEIFAEGMRAYADEGFPEAWKGHHQGGPIGYFERDFLAYPGCKEKVVAPQAFAWNPTLPGAKAEETIIVYSNAVETITRSPNWPYKVITVDGLPVEVPDILVR